MCCSGSSLFVRVDTTISTGSYNQSVGLAYTTAPGGTRGAAITLDRAFIQFGPVTAGRLQSFFDFYADALNWTGVRGSNNLANLLAYTAIFGSGFSATLSLEDANERLNDTGNFANAGSDYPDLVGALNLKQGWGEAQLSGAIFQRKTRGTTGFGSGEKIGFAIQGGVKFKLPMLAAGDELWLQAAYTEGGLSYIGFEGNGANVGQPLNTNVGRLRFNNSDANVDAFGSLELTKGHALTAGFMHYWTPTIRQTWFGSYAKLDYANNLTKGAIGQDPAEWRAGTDLIWSPVAGLDIGVDILYINAGIKNRIQANGRPTGVLLKSDDALQGRLRIERDF